MHAIGICSPPTRFNQVMVLRCMFTKLDLGHSIISLLHPSAGESDGDSRLFMLTEVSTAAVISVANRLSLLLPIQSKEVLTERHSLLSSFRNMRTFWQSIYARFTVHF